MTPTLATSDGTKVDRAGQSLLVVRGLNARYGRIEVCSGIDVSAGRNEIVAILGPNGAGKSSLFGAIAGTVSGGGEMRVAGIDFARKSAHERAKSGIAFVPEIRGNIFQALSVLENLQIGLRMVDVSGQDERLSYIYDLFPILKERTAIAAGMLSGGEQQMLAIGMAVARRPDVLLLDEPTQGLAPRILDTLQTVLHRLRSDGMVILLAEQNIPFAARVSDRFLVLVGGSIVANGEAKDLLDSQAVLAKFLGTNEPVGKLESANS